jgi:hypothetical protein
MTDYKTNFFGTFLDTMKSVPPSQTTVGRALAASQPLAKAGPADAVLHALLEHNGEANVNDLLPLTGFSVDGLATVVNTLVAFNLVEREIGRIVLTQAGRQAASAKVTNAQVAA